jgi:hypothetical protein
MTEGQYQEFLYHLHHDLNRLTLAQVEDLERRLTTAVEGYFPALKRALTPVLVMESARAVVCRAISSLGTRETQAVNRGALVDRLTRSGVSIGSFWRSSRRRTHQQEERSG